MNKENLVCPRSYSILFYEENKIFIELNTAMETNHPFGMIIYNFIILK